MEKELQENTSKVNSEELSKILEEKDAEDNIINNKKPPIGKTLMEMYGLHTPTSAIIDYISNRKAFNTRLAIAIFLFITSTLPPVIMSNIFYIDSIGVLLIAYETFDGEIWNNSYAKQFVDYSGGYVSDLREEAPGCVFDFFRS